jgi:ferritin-like metal-binding protein YciE
MSPVATTTSMRSLKDLLIEQVNELHTAEMQSETVLGKLAAASSSPKLADAIRSHIDETKQHMARLDRVFGELGIKPKRAEMHGAKGLLDDCAAIAGRAKIDPHVRDAAIIAAMQRLEHDEIAGYGCARTWASLLGLQASASELLKSLTEERRFDESLSRIAETLNKSALEPMAASR